VPGNNVAILQIPGGETFCPPVENEATGILHMDFGKRRCVFRFEKGLLSDIDLVDKPPEEVEILKPRYGVGDVQLCEFGIGTNKHARVIPTGPIFEKTYGTIHIGCGCNDTFGGNLKGNKHYDIIVQDPTVNLDGKIFEFDGY
jgi:leucyl aminopeptidase (aminopeptidase T)